MTTADTNIAALRSGHDSLTAQVGRLSDDDLAGPSGAAQWDVAKVLNHLGSGAEIAQARIRAAVDARPSPDGDFNQSVWDRWNALSRRESADRFVTSNAALVELYEAMDADMRDNLRIDLGFLPAPVEVAVASRMRLSEFTLHTWDVRAGFEENAVLAPEAVGPLLPGVGDLLGWIGKVEPLNGRHLTIRVTTTEPTSSFALHLADRVGLDPDVPQDVDGALTLPAEAWLRLVAGRLSPRHTPAQVNATGAADLDLLRRIFPGY